jgi:hypothetical protein
MKFILVVLAALLPLVAYPIGEGGDTEWPKGAIVEVQLRLFATVGTNGQVKVSGDLIIKNPGTTPLTIQNPHNRQVLAFLVFDPLGNPVAPVLRGKADPDFRTHTLSPRATYTHHFEGLDFVTGSAWLSYELSPGKTSRVVAVYRPAGPHGPGFTSPETNLEISNWRLDTEALHPRFALYLVKTPHAEIAKTELESQPLLTEQDIVSYDWQTHTITLTESGEKKIPDTKAVGTWGKEFLIVADGQRCYLGAFWISLSSIGHNNPIIDVAQRGPVVQIQRSYPSDRFATGDDPRPDKRIRRALEALGIITNVKGEFKKDK